MKSKPKISKECKCGNVFHVLPYREGTAFYCSARCRQIYREYKPNRGSFKSGAVEYKRSRANVPIVCGIYKITNPNGAVYIGGSRTIYRRWLRHREARKKIKIHLSIKQFGWKAHEFKIIHELPKDVDNDTLIRYEQLYMDLYRDCGSNMLNVKDAGSKAKFPQESKSLMKESNKKKYAVKYNGNVIEFIGLKQFCIDNNIAEKSFSDLIHANGHYRSKNYYKGYSRLND